MNISRHERALLPFIAFQAAVGTLGGFIGYFVVGNQDVNAMFQFAALMLTFVAASLILAYVVGPRLCLSSKHLLKIGFFIPGVILLSGYESVLSMAAAFGILQGLTWAARHLLEMSLISDRERDGYASHAGAISVIGGILATLAATVVLALSKESRQYVYWMYGSACILASFMLGRGMSCSPLKHLKNPIAVLKQREFTACLPLFFLQSGFMGLALAVGAVGANKALASASSFGWVATVAGLAGGIGLYLTRNSRGVDNRSRWLGGSCLAVAVAFAMLGASAWVPALFIISSMIKAVADPFLGASELVLNQKALEIQGELNDRIVAREFAFWALRMTSLGSFWILSSALTPVQLLATGSAILAFAVALEFLIGQGWFADAAVKTEEPAYAIR